MIKMYFTLLLLIFIQYISSSVGSSKFYNGRFKKSSIGIDSSIVYDGEFINSEWVKLPVNHFSQHDKRTFQNVGILNIIYNTYW